MKKIIFIIAMLFLNTSCATGLDLRFVKKYEKIHPEFAPYVSEFVYMSNGKVDFDDFRYITMGFRDYEDGSNTVGTCHHIVDEIDISREWWNSYKTPSERLELVFHEFGHCILKRGHANKPKNKGFLTWLERLGFDVGIFDEKGYMYDGCPASFMHPYTIGDRCINKHFAYYIKELFYKDEAINYVETRKIHYSENRCKKPEVINYTDNWNKRDQDTLERAKVTCIERYRSCLKTFIKKEPLTYNAICE